MEYTDIDCLDIIKEIDELFEDLTEWEYTFIESNLKRKTFSENQKTIIQKLEGKYLK